MTTQLDSSIGIKKETTYGTAVTVDHFPEFLSESLEWKPDIKQGQGFRAGSRVARSERRFVGKSWCEGDVELEMAARGCGIFLEALFGASVSTIIGVGPAYQQNFTVATTDPVNSYTIQKGIAPLGGGAVLPHTFAGAVCTKGELSAANGEVVKLKTSWNAKGVDTSTGYAAPSFVANNEVFNFSQAVIAVGGSPTAPTTTALATGGTAATNILDFSLSFDSKPDTNGFGFGGGGKQSRRPALGMGEIKGKLTAEFDTVTLRDAFLNQTSLPVVLTFTSATSIAAGIFYTLQVYLPAIRLNGDIPNADQAVSKQSIDFDVVDNGSGASPVTVVLRTLDTVV